jgi:hypothetical protein
VGFLLLFSKILFAQQYPVNVNANVLTPMPSKLTNFYTDNTQKLFVILTNKDMGNPSIPVKLKVTIIGSSTQIVSRVGSEIGVSPILLDAGVPKALTQQDLAPYFNINNLDFVGGFSKSQYNTTGVLPEGNYSICVQVLDFYNNRPLSNPFCTYGSIFFSQPPNLLTPISNHTISGQDNKVINFTWAPNHLNNRDVVAGGYKYIVTLKEILDSTQNINQAYITANTKLTEEVSNNQFILNTMTTPLISGRKYAWTVQVKANNPEAQSTLANNGISQVFGFTYDDNCMTPKNIIANISKNKATISWQNTAGSTVTTIKYKEVNGVEYTKKILPNANSITLEELNYETAYEFSMVVQCGSNVLVLDPKQFRIPAKPIAQKYLFKKSVYWSVKEGSQGDYSATGVQLKSIFQGISSKTIEKAIPNNKFGLKLKLNDTTLTVSNSTSNIINKTLLNGAKITLFENGEILESVTANTIGRFEIPIDTERIIANQHLRYYVRFDYPNQQNGINNVGYIAPDSVLLTGMRSGRDIVRALFSREFVCASADYTIIHPVVYVGQNQATSLSNKAGAVVEVFIQTTDKSSLKSRVLGYYPNPLNNESYNGETYSKIGSLNDNKAFLPISYLKEGEKLLFKVSINGYPKQYYPLSILPENRNTKILNIPLDYNPLVSIQGKVYKNPQKELEKLNKSAVIAYDKTTKAIIDATTTNADGTYSLGNIPFSKLGNIYVSAAPFNETTQKVDNARSSNNYDIYTVRYDVSNMTSVKVTQVDITYDKEIVDIIYGQAISSETRKAIPDVTILYDNTKVGNTTEDGFFAFKLKPSQRDVTKFKIVCDNKQLDAKQTIQFIQQNFGEWEKTAKTTSYSKSEDSKNKVNSELLTNLVNNSNTYGDESRKTVSVLLDTLRESLGSYYVANINIADFLRYKVTFTLGGVKQNVALYELTNDERLTINPTDTTYYLTVKDYHSDQRKFYTIMDTTVRWRTTTTHCLEDDKKATTFVPLRNQQVFFSTTNNRVNFVLKPLKTIKVIIRDSVSRDLIEGVNIQTEQIKSNTISYKSGEYFVYLGNTSEVKLIISKSFYVTKVLTVRLDNLTKDTLDLNINLEKTKNSSINKLLGFDVTITKQTFLRDSTYSISGTLMIDDKKNNQTFAISNQILWKFYNKEVRVNSEGNASLVDEAMEFPAPLYGTMYGFASITIDSVRLKKKNNSPTSYEGVLTGHVIVQDFNTPLIHVRPSRLNINTLDIVASDSVGTKAIENNTMFYLSFSVGLSSHAPFYGSLMSGSTINIRKDSCSISRRGITLKGDFGLPSSIFGNSSERFAFDSLIMAPNLTIQDFTINVNRRIYNINQWRFQLERVTLSNIMDPTRRAFSFGGQLFLTDNTTDATRNALSVRNFEVRRDGESNLSVTARFTIPESGINLKSLTFNPSQRDIDMAYSAENGLILNSSGNITCSQALSSFSFITDKVFPLEVNRFALASRDLSVLAALSPTLEINYGVFKITATKAVISVGSGINIDKANSYLLGDTTALIPDATSTTNDADWGWAFGLTGSVAFEVDGLNPLSDFGMHAATSFIVGHFGDRTHFRINDVNIGYNNAAVELAARVQLRLAGDTIGATGSGKLVIGGVGLDTASFHFYRIRGSDISIGALARARVRGIITGPVSWYNVGGGFDYESSSRTIRAYLSGTFGPAGTTMETTTAYVDIERLGIEFNIEECGAWPVIFGNGELFMKKPMGSTFVRVGTAEARADFCRNLLYLTANVDARDYLPQARMRFNGLILGMVNNNQGSLFMNVNGTIGGSGPMGENEVNGTLTLGINYDNNATNVPTEVRNNFRNVPEFVRHGTDKSRMDGLYCSISKTLINRGFYGFSVGPVNAGIRYSANLTVGAELFVNIRERAVAASMNASFDLTADATLGVSVIEKTVGGVRANLTGRLTGGYSGDRGIFVDGEARGRLEASVGEDADCNDYATFGPGAKVCFDGRILASWSSSNGFTIHTLTR